MALAVARLITTKKALIAMSLACLTKLCRIMRRPDWGGLKESNLRLQSIQRQRTSVRVVLLSRPNLGDPDTWQDPRSE